jgi:hypothetical protein
MSKVFLVETGSGENSDAIARKIRALWRKADFDSVFKANDLAAVKLHVGEPGTKTFVSPAIAAACVKCIAATGAKPFLTDTIVLYRGPRDNAVGHAMVAIEHGFTFEKVGAPFVVADGLIGSDELEVEVHGKHFEKVGIASAIMHARSMLVLSHATGHLATGFGGALKNMGMGCGSKKAKLKQHFGHQPRIARKKCTACGECSVWCPSDAISVARFAAIDSEKCIGCGECIAVCQEGAVAFDWSVKGPELQERIVEHALAVAKSKHGRICYITAAQNITKDCDCIGLSQQPLVEDIGILASFDPVALDKAVIDLIVKRAGRTLESMSYPKTNSSVQISYAESLGLGQSSYDLINIDAQLRTR